ncbi:MAG: preprotein translocase subunit SecG, partial [Bdellovibrionales bacterium]|nr:preprotein translocase subunit SecG [Bdellovibrionales bacterium]
MYTFLIVLYLIICLLLTLVILLQSGKGAGMGVSFGGASATMFGGSGGSNFLSKITGWFSVSFIVISILLARMSIPDKPNVKCQPNKWECDSSDKAKKKRMRCDANGAKYIRNESCEYGCDQGMCKDKPKEKETPKKKTIELKKTPAPKKVTPKKDAPKKD